MYEPIQDTLPCKIREEEEEEEILFKDGMTIKQRNISSNELITVSSN